MGEVMEEGMIIIPQILRADITEVQFLRLRTILNLLQITLCLKQIQARMAISIMKRQTIVVVTTEAGLTGLRRVHHPILPLRIHPIITEDKRSPMNF